MSQAVTGSLKIATSASETVTIGLGTGALTTGIGKSYSFTNGSAANLKVQYQFSVSKTAAASTPDTYTLSALTDSLSRTYGFTNIRMILITNDGTVDGQPLLVGGAGTHPWVAPFDDATATISIATGGCLVLCAPSLTAYPVVSSSSDQLKINPGSNAIPYTLHILGD